MIEMKKVDLSGIKFLVLDEADRMLDMVSFCMAMRLRHRRVFTLFLTAIIFVLTFSGIRATNPINC